MGRARFGLPDDRPRPAVARGGRPLHVELDLELDVEARALRGTCHVRLRRDAPGPGVIVLDACELAVSQVRCDGAVAPHRHDGAQLHVDLPGPTPLECIVSIDYEARPRRGLYFVGPDPAHPDRPRQVWTHGQDQEARHWFPCFDAPDAKATTALSARLPPGMTLVSNGVPVAVDAPAPGRDGGFRFRHDRPHAPYVVSMVAAELTAVAEAWDGVQIVSYAPPDRLEALRRTSAVTGRVMAFLSEAFRVRYPHPRYTQTFVADFEFGGMENTAATTFADDWLLDERAWLDTDIEWNIAHEMSHAWFGDLVTCRSWSHAWLHEGFATYAEYLWSEHRRGREIAHLELERWAQEYFAEDEERYRRPLVTDDWERPRDLFDKHLYRKGAWVVHMLRRRLSDAAFFDGLGEFLHRHAFRTVETRDLVDALQRASGQDLEGFFDQWVLRGAGYPELAVSSIWSERARCLELTVRQEQVRQGDPPFGLDAMVRFRVRGADVDRPLRIETAEQTFAFALDEPPTQIIFDPGGHLLARVVHRKERALWLEELRAATDPVDRRRAAQELASAAPTACAELARTLRRDPAWTVRAAAAAALGALGEPGARDALLEALHEEPALAVTRSVVAALGAFRGDLQVAAALRPLVGREAGSYFVEGEAMVALARVDPDAALRLLPDQLRRGSYRDVLREHALRGLAATGSPAVLPHLRAACRQGAAGLARPIALECLVELLQGRPDAAAAEAPFILRFLDDPELPMRLAAAEGLVALRLEATAALRRAATEDLDGRLRRRVRELLR